MNLTWLGHACFLIETNEGTKIITDPFDETVGYPIYKGKVDIVTVSHEHFDHNYTKFFSDYAQIVRTPKSFDFKGVSIQGFPSFHDEVKGAKRGENTIFKIECDGIKICHLGDLGHLLTAEDIDLIGDVDVLLIPVGDNYTLGGKEGAKLSKMINSKITIPMHYKTPQLTFELDGVENFLTHMKIGEKVSNCSINIEEYIEGNKKKVLVLTLS
ncbi:MBL fold metallo-hydrolase [Clostridium senegalense]|uniref:MBL fold metallo-hydrolase n=1 Tax=Clostridium senegalense TaxID=1465809 RepID=A0A6M0GZL0_9CLOT|nr:MBL fold metallo-hydrolase [Clostridium senegalense]NEU04036.1 MBL fold metallo-hydrolase [Clostridium senegalense]